MRTRLAPRGSSLTPLQSLIARRWRPQWVCQDCRTSSAIQWRGIANTTATATAETDKPFYTTTPIFYVNAAPHVGHMYSMVLADVIKRWQQLQNRRAILCTGTDEHGLKIQQAAAKAGLDPKQFCDKGADVFKDLAAQIDMSHDIFMRTTDAKHKRAVEYAWQMLETDGYIYQGAHQGWYSVSDETFYPQSQVQLIVDPPTGRKIMVSIETGKEVEWTKERNYHFRLSSFRERLLQFYERNPDFVVPKTKMDEVVKEVTTGLEDLSISRPVERLNWGVRVPSDPSQTMYVWLDALLNYATAIGYPFTPGAQTAAGWPPDVQIIGKDIVRFHCIYWPAFLMALDLPLPKQILVHAHWTLGRQKMSKSTGNVVNPFFALERFGVDTMRWFLIHNGGITDDADYDNQFIIRAYKKNLQDGLGNLASRILRFKGWDVARAVKRFGGTDFHGDKDTRGHYLRGQLAVLPKQVDAHMRDLLPNKALQRIMAAVRDANAHLQHTTPWDLARKIPGYKKSSPESNADLSEEQLREAESIRDQLDRIVYLDAEALRLIGILLQPFMPDAAGRLLDMVGVRKDRRHWEWCEFGIDTDYGVPMVDLGQGEKGFLFPGLTSTF